MLCLCCFCSFCYSLWYIGWCKTTPLDASVCHIPRQHKWWVLPAPEPRQQLVMAWLGCAGARLAPVGICQAADARRPLSKPIFPGWSAIPRNSVNTQPWKTAWLLLQRQQSKGGPAELCRLWYHTLVSEWLMRLSTSRWFHFSSPFAQPGYEFLKNSTFPPPFPSFPAGKALFPMAVNLGLVGIMLVTPGEEHWRCQHGGSGVSLGYASGSRIIIKPQRQQIY